MWEIYDKLIEEIPKDILVNNITIGLSWTVVEARSGDYCGAAMTVNEQLETTEIARGRRGQSLKYLASYIKSWNFTQASIGMAAINAYYNNRETLKNNLNQGRWEIAYGQNPFDEYAQAVTGKKVAVIGHFRYLEKYLTEAEQVSILERTPIGDDYPDSACEYLLPEQDFVFITGSTMINKTLPRLLELSKNAQTILVGPSTPLTPVIFNYGVDEISGFIAGCNSDIRDAAAIGNHTDFFQSGIKTRMVKKTF